MRRVVVKFAKHFKIADRKDCWIWTAPASGGSDYGQFWYDGRNQGAHRVMYQLVVGPIPEGFQLDHLCRNRRCVNPTHLEAVTAYENNMRSESSCAKKARQTECLRGHPLTGENLQIFNGKRRCVTCHRLRGKSRATLFAITGRT